MVIMLRIGQSAALLFKSVMIGYDRRSETERVWVNNESLINLNLLKIQSAPLGNHWDQAFDGDRFCPKQMTAQ
jgi:hypothetical protein